MSFHHVDDLAAQHVKSPPLGSLSHVREGRAGIVAQHHQRALGELHRLRAGQRRAADLRRGRETANALWGNEASVLVGDFLYSRAFQMMVDMDSMPIMRILADATAMLTPKGAVLYATCSLEREENEAQEEDAAEGDRLDRVARHIRQRGALRGLVSGADEWPSQPLAKLLGDRDTTSTGCD